MKRVFLAIFLLPSICLGRTAIDTTGVGLGDGYDVGDSLGGFEIVQVVHLTTADFPLDIGTSGESQTNWDVYVLDSNMTISAGSGVSAINFSRESGTSNAPRKIIIDFRGFTLTVNQDSNVATQAPAINLGGVGGGPSTAGGVSDSIIIKNGELRHNLNFVTTTSEDAGWHGSIPTIMLKDIRWIDIINMDIKVNHAYSLDPNRWSVGGLGIRSTSAGAQERPSNSLYGPYQIYLDDVGVWVYSTAFYRRDRTYASGMYLGGVHRKDSMLSLFPSLNETIDTGWYHYTVKNCVVHITPHFGYYLNGTLDFHDNICSTAARNDYYEYFAGPDGDPKQNATKRAANSYTFPDASYPNSGTWPVIDSGVAYGTAGSNGWHQMWTSDNSYGIVLSDGFETSGISAGPGTKIYNNVIARRAMSGANHWQGNRGISVEGAIGTSSEPVLIYNNNVEMSQGRNGGFSTGSGWGMRIRWGPQWVKVYDNTFTVYLDSRPGDGVTPGDSIPSSAGLSGYGIRATFTDEHGGSVGNNIWIYHNTINTVLHTDSVLGQGTASVSGYGLEVDNRRTGFQDGTNIHIYENHYNVMTRGLWLGGGSGSDGGVQLLTVRGDTISRQSPYDTANWKSVYSGWGGINDSGNYLLDLVYLNGATESQYSVGTGDNDEYKWGRIMNILAVGTGTPPNVGVKICSLIAINAYSDTVQNLVPFDTATAVVQDTFIYQHKGSGAFAPDSLAFNNFTFKARTGASVTPDSVITINAGRDAGLILVFSDVAGELDTTGWRGVSGGGGGGGGSSNTTTTIYYKGVYLKGVQ